MHSTCTCITFTSYRNTKRNEIMETLVKTKSGKIITIKDAFTSTKSDYRGKLIIQNQLINSSWFVRESGKVTFVSDDFQINGDDYRTTGEVVQMSPELKNFVDWYISDLKKNNKERQEWVNFNNL